MGLSGVALAARLTTFVLAAAPYLLGGVAAVVALAVIAYGAYVIAQKVTIKNVIKKIPSKLKSGDKVNLSKFTGDGPKPPKGGRAWFGPLGWYIVKDIDKHKGVWKLFDWAGRRIATLAADGTVLGK